uniref:PH domain-containing protein n=1 Tax=Soboliphyme baturini TaxID=241478 RepID=A0A183IQ57_9BILA
LFSLLICGLSVRKLLASRKFSKPISRRVKRSKLSGLQSRMLSDDQSKSQLQAERMARSSSISQVLANVILDQYHIQKTRELDTYPASNFGKNEWRNERQRLVNFVTYKLLGDEDTQTLKESFGWDIASQPNQNLSQWQTNVDMNDSLRILSPKIFSVVPEKGNVTSLLSPHFLSLYSSQNINEVLPLSKLLKSSSKAEQTAWMRVILELSKSTEKLRELGMEPYKDLKQQKYRSLLKQRQTMTTVFKRLERMYSDDQRKALMKRGYAFLNKRQLQLLYGSSNVLKISERPKFYESFLMMSDDEKEKFLLKDVTHMLAGMKPKQKRQVVLNPLILTPIVLQPAFPLVLSPVILSPSVLGPLVLSPLVLSPLVLSPSVLVLAPIVLFPLVLSPLTVCPLVLSPFVLSPLILNPLTVSPAILNPLVLSPLILTPYYKGALILAPRVLSPLIRSPIGRFIITGSPSILSRRRKKRWVWNSTSHSLVHI